MTARSTVRIGALAMVLAALAVAVPSASAVIVQLPNGKYASVLVTSGSSPAALPGFAHLAPRGAARTAGVSSNGNLDYGGGPVLHSSAPYLIFWDPNGTISFKTLLGQYFADVAADNGKATNVFAVARQYFDTAGFADYHHTFSPAQIIDDTNPYPSNGCARTAGTYPTCLTDSQLQAEIQSLVTARGLPTGVVPNAPIYFIVTEPSVNVCFTSSGTTCDDTSPGFCAYHSASLPPGGGLILYSAIPGFFNGASGIQNPKRCQADNQGVVQEPNGSLGDVVIKYASHEYIETLTDPIPPSAWVDTASSNEIGDNCDFYGATKNPQAGSNPLAFQPTLGGTAGAGTLYNQLINGHRYYTQSEWSNGLNDCAMQPAAGIMSAAIGGPAGATPIGTSVIFNATGSSTNGYSSVTVAFGDGTTAFDSSGAGPAPTAHTYTHAGRYTVTLATVDAFGNLQQASTQVTIGSPPTPAFSISPGSAATGVPVRFTSISTDPDAGVTIASTAFAFGDGGSATSASASHVYSKPGTYTVTMAIVNSLGLMSTTRRTVKIVRAKIVKVKFTSKKEQLAVTVNAPGELSGVGKSKKAKGPGTYTLKLSGAQEAQLASTGQLKLKIKFKPAAGKTFTKALRI